MSTSTVTPLTVSPSSSLDYAKAKVVLSRLAKQPPKDEEEPNPAYRSDPRRQRHPPGLPDKYTWTDYYAIGVSLILLLIMIPFSLIIIPFTFMPLALWAIYGQCLPKPTQVIKRNCSFAMLKVATFVVALPALLILVIWPMIVFVLNFVLCLPYVVARCRFGVVASNFRTLWPWMSFGRWNWDGINAAMVGSVYRQGFCEYFSQFTHKLLAVPIIKWVMVANPWLYKLEEQYINQWTPKLDDDGESIEDVIDGATSIPSCALHTKAYRKIIDDHIFSVHYPLPPKFDQTKGEGAEYKAEIGIQTPTGTQKRNIVLVTNTVTHFHKPRAKAKRSTLSIWAVYEVNLFWFNPYHFLTGVVEVNLTEEMEMEHPCFVIAGTGSRLSLSTMDLSDYFFVFGAEAAEFADKVMVENDVP